jgi:hypothetical protein
MAHHINAVLLKGPFDEGRAESFGLKPLLLTKEITLFPLDAEYLDSLSERLGIDGWVSKHPLFNHRVVHHMIRSVAEKPLFAVIETDYVGGDGSQCAAVYRGEEQVMAPEEARRGPINKALRLLGVRRSFRRDEFDTVGLEKFRDFDDLFDE